MHACADDPQAASTRARLPKWSIFAVLAETIATCAIAALVPTGAAGVLAALRYTAHVLAVGAPVAAAAGLAAVAWVHLWR